ncbi:MAG: hypothetical protein CL931_14365 [Deltaproteobacteria bacterium]|nr:hypothetical protein [Deltaproteobacteria bacterium]
MVPHRIARSTVLLTTAALLAAGVACLPEPPATETTTARAASERALAPSGEPYSEDREPCANRDPLRQALWGELHVHSTLSMDAWLWDVRSTPDDVFRFAKGEEIRFAPLDAEGSPTRPAQLERPIDFASLTDHASFQGEVAMCTRPEEPGYESPACAFFRGEVPFEPNPAGDFATRMGAISAALQADGGRPARRGDLCGEEGAGCIGVMQSVWEEQQAAAERHYDRSENCRFTSLHGYEYTATPDLAKVHHNVIFRNANVPEKPIAWIDEPDVYGLWEKLAAQCRDAATGCDVITLPHNSNLSNGNMFATGGRDLPIEAQRDRARLRADIERLVELNQIKGDSECRNGFSNVLGGRDEFCEFEEWRGPDVTECGPDEVGVGALVGTGCVHRRDYVRYALAEGFREQARIGVNPFKIGIVAATDAHNGNPGDVEEYSFQGWSGITDDTREERIAKSTSPMQATNSLMANPGGLAGVWAEENSRDAIFNAMKRKETFGTSGPRITARFFGGWDYPEDLCGDPELVSKGYAGGVPMGGDLPTPPSAEAAPVFVVSAMRDVGIPAHPGGLLQRAQVVKGWIDAEDNFHQQVIDVAGGENDAYVDEATCQPRGNGHNSLCTVWTDPDFNANQNAFYYVRVLENPSCRWSARQCLEEANDPNASGRSSGCEDSSIPKTIQERLWTSPIWFDAPAAG